MKKELNIAALVMYSLLIFNSIAITVALMITHLQSKAADGLGAAIGAVISLILAIIFSIYTLLAVPPIALKICSIKNPKRRFTVLCIPFDAIFVLSNLVMIISLFGNIETIGLLWIGFMLLLSIASLVINIALLKDDRD